VLSAVGSAARCPLGDFLQEPAVAVRVLERGEGAVAGTLRVRARDAFGGSGVVEDAGGVAERSVDLDATSGQLGDGFLDVGDDQVQAVQCPGCGGGDAGAEDDRAFRAGWVTWTTRYPSFTGKSASRRNTSCSV
jgi:hypothetical protein